MQPQNTASKRRAAQAASPALDGAAQRAQRAAVIAWFKELAPAQRVQVRVARVLFAAGLQTSRRNHVCAWRGRSVMWARWAHACTSADD